MKTRPRSGVSGPATESVGDLIGNQLREVPTAGFATTADRTPTTGWGTQDGSAFVSALAAMP
jgi:hypothetical protein